MREFLSRQLRRARRIVFPRLWRRDLLTGADREAALDVLYRLLVARTIDERGRRHYIELMRDHGVSLRDIAVELAASDEFHERLRRRTTRRFYPDQEHRPAGYVDVRELIERQTLEELVQAAEEYYGRTKSDLDRYHAKPLADLHDAPELLGSFAALLAGLRLARGMRVLDFGAGPGWTTRFLTQLGCEVISLDVSPTALDIGKQLFERLPPIGPCPAPQFLLFDGRHIDLPAESVDRVFSFDAFHHVPNPDEVLRECARVLRPGGIAGFSEPGPNQSNAAHSQYEMKNFAIVENDLFLSDIWKWAEAAGFTGLEVAVFNNLPTLVSLEQFDDLIAGGQELEEYGDKLRGFLMGNQTFYLYKGPVAADSRLRQHLKATIAVRLDADTVMAGESLRGDATLTNVGSATWLAGAAPAGGVSLGVHLRTRRGDTLDIDYARIPLEHEIQPGETQRVAFSLPSPAPGAYTLEFDLVSENVAWFEANGSETVIIPITVRDTRPL